MPIEFGLRISVLESMLPTPSLGSIKTVIVTLKHTDSQNIYVLFPTLKSHIKFDTDYS